MKFCFLGRPLYDKYTVALYKGMQKRDKNIQACYVVMDEDEEKYIRNELPNVNVYNFSRFYKENEVNCSIDKLSVCEEKYDCKPIWKYIYTDRFLITKDYDYVVKTTVAMFLFFENVYDIEKPNFYFSETIATLFCYIGYLVGKQKNTRYVTLFGARGLFSTHHYFSMDPCQDMPEFDKGYQNQNYSDDEKKWAEDFWKDFLNNYAPPSYMKTAGAKPKFKISFFKQILIRVFARFKKKYNNKYSYIKYKSYVHATDGMKFYFKYKRAKHYYKEPDFKDKYVLYPLHFQPEASTIVCAQKFEKQLFFIDEWAKSLPAGMKLYVKEHYAFLGHRDISFYNELNKYPNVVLINPWASTQELIKKSVAVTTLTGTAGWEAMLLRKPVFIGGNIYFCNAPGVIKINDIYDDFVRLLNEWEMPSDEQMIKYLCAYHRAIKEGNSSAGNLSDDNIDLLVNSLLESVSKYNK